MQFCYRCPCYNCNYHSIKRAGRFLGVAYIIILCPSLSLGKSQIQSDSCDDYGWVHWVELRLMTWTVLLLVSLRIRRILYSIANHVVCQNDQHIIGDGQNLKQTNLFQSMQTQPKPNARTRSSMLCQHVGNNNAFERLLLQCWCSHSLDAGTGDDRTVSFAVQHIFVCLYWNVPCWGHQL